MGAEIFSEVRPERGALDLPGPARRIRVEPLRQPAPEPQCAPERQPDESAPLHDAPLRERTSLPPEKGRRAAIMVEHLRPLLHAVGGVGQNDLQLA